MWNDSYFDHLVLSYYNETEKKTIKVLYLAQRMAEYLKARTHALINLIASHVNRSLIYQGIDSNNIEF